ncbi:hypothetical protein KCP76_25845 [Salmonella enterica subsp. enterica serovar Weltevreden]|nr:hypothetical protein KCP76_25845 [Salmonella enterica subsp. enterica serovar Weltevreden]
MYRLCPRHLIGHELSTPHLLVRAVNTATPAAAAPAQSALTCSECSVWRGLPVGSPMRISRMLKRELRAQNQRYKGPLNRPTKWRNIIAGAVLGLIAKLGLSPRYGKHRWLKKSRQ